MSDTTAMIEVTATMLPRTVMKDRSFADQMASSAMIADSQRFRRRLPAFPALLFLAVVHLHRIAVRHAAHRVEGAGDHLVARLDAVEHLEILVAGDSHLDGDEFGAALADNADPF